MVRSNCERNHTTFIILLRAAEAHCQWQFALELLQQMGQARVRATPMAYAAAVGACAAGEVKMK
jgi:hypothetical protein